jgi:hypothetical protein
MKRGRTDGQLFVWAFCVIPADRYIFVHACCRCPGPQALREAWWDMIIEHFNLDLYV